MGVACVCCGRLGCAFVFWGHWLQFTGAWTCAYEWHGFGLPLWTTGSFF